MEGHAHEPMITHCGSHVVLFIVVYFFKSDDVRNSWKGGLFTVSHVGQVFLQNLIGWDDSEV